MKRLHLPVMMLVSGLWAALPQAHAQAQKKPVHPSQTLVAADISTLVHRLEIIPGATAAKPLADAQATHDTMKARGLLKDLPPEMESYIEAYAKKDDTGAAALLNHLSPFETGLVAYIRQDYARAQKLWLPIAQAGDQEAELDVAIMYAGGAHGATDSDTEAAKWFGLAAAQGNVIAQENIGSFYADGRGAPKNLARAYMWLTVAADQWAANTPRSNWGATLLKQRDAFAATMTSDEMAQAVSMTVKCNSSQYKTCG